MADKMVDSRTQAEIIGALCEKLRAKYVFPNVAEKICEALKGSLSQGDFDGVTEGEFFALALTKTLQSVNGDEHLGVRWYPDPLPDDAGSQLQNEERLVEFRERARQDNYGFHKIERLAGNIGYLDIHYFWRPSWGSGETATGAMNVVANTEALIIDLRQCRGGNPNMVMLLSSYLFEGEPVHLNSLYWREDDSTQQYWTLPYLPGKRFGDKPVYVLTSAGTFSAGEEFVNNLQAQKRATLVGETTGGGAHPGSPFRLSTHFEVFIPMGRAINPITGDDWEGRGVIPDIAVPQEEALDAAYKMALESVVDGLGEPDSGPSKRLLDEARAALRGRL